MHAAEETRGGFFDTRAIIIPLLYSRKVSYVTIPSPHYIPVFFNVLLTFTTSPDVNSLLIFSDIHSDEANRSRVVRFSMFGFSSDKTLVSFVPIWNRSLMLLSTFHNDDKIDETSKKPEIIIDYNRTNWGVNTVDQLCRTYSVKRSTRRWPLSVFYGLLDIGAVKSFIIFMYNNPVSSQGKLQGTNYVR